MSSSSAPPVGAPLRYIFDATDHAAFVHSPAHSDFVLFISAISQALVGKGNSTPCHVSPVLSRLLSFLGEMGAWVDALPPLAQPMRYGNRAFRSWHERLIREASRMCHSLLSSADAGAAAAGEAAAGEAAAAAAPSAASSAAPALLSPPSSHAGALSDASLVAELAPYLIDAFGNSTRIDYGTGHETGFVLFLCAFDGPRAGWRARWNELCAGGLLVWFCLLFIVADAHFF